MGMQTHALKPRVQIGAFASNTAKNNLEQNWLSTPLTSLVF